MARQGIMREIRPPPMTPHGLKWALANLHPCSEAMTDAVLLPDDLTMPRQATRMQRTFTVGYPGDCTTTVNVNLDQCGWNLLVLTTPWPEIPFMFYICEGNGEPVGLSDYIAQGQWNLRCVDTPGVVIEPRWWYYALYPNFSDLSQLSVKFPDAGEPNDLRKKYSRIRVIGKGTTTYLNASRLNDGGRLIAGQYPCAARFIDSFNPGAYHVDVNKLIKYIKQSLCVEQPSSSPPPGYLEHVHDVPPADLTHAHSYISTSEHAHGIGQIPSLNLTGTNHTHNIQPAYATRDKDLNVTLEGRVGPSELGGASTEQVIRNWNDNYTGRDPNDKRLTMLDHSGDRRDWATDRSGKVTAQTRDISVYGENDHPGFMSKTVFTNDPNNSSGKFELPASTTSTGRAIQAEGALAAEAKCLTLTEIEHGDNDERDAKIQLVRDDKVEDHPDWYVSEPPYTENMLFYGDPKAVTWEARKGCYMPIRIERYEMEDCHMGKLYPYNLTNTDPNVLPETQNGFNVPTLNIAGTGTWGVTYYRNISKASSITIKTVQYTDGIVNSAGPFSAMQPQEADPDPSAVMFVTQEAKRLQHAYYASANDLGTILGNILGVAKNIGRVVKDVSGGLSGVPVVGDVANAISGILSSLGI